MARRPATAGRVGLTPTPRVESVRRRPATRTAPLLPSVWPEPDAQIEESMLRDEGSAPWCITSFEGITGGLDPLIRGTTDTRVASPRPTTLRPREVTKPAPRTGP